MSQLPINYQEGKVFKDLDFQIMICKEKIKNHEMSIKKAKKMAGMYGPSSVGGLDYSRQPTTRTANISIADAYRMIDRDTERINELQEQISALRKRKRNLIKALRSLDGLEEQIFYHRVILCETQDASSEAIGLSKRHLQRIEKRMKETSKIFEI